MTENIRKQIKEACVKYCEQVNSVYNEQDIFEAGANFILSKWQEANRWKKVDEELPEVKQEGYYILARDAKGTIITYHVSVYHDEGSIREDLTYQGAKEWQPINP